MKRFKITVATLAAFLLAGSCFAQSQTPTNDQRLEMQTQYGTMYSQNVPLPNTILPFTAQVQGQVTVPAGLVQTSASPQKLYYTPRGMGELRAGFGSVEKRMGELEAGQQNIVNEMYKLQGNLDQQRYRGGLFAPKLENAIADLLAILLLLALFGLLLSGIVWLLSHFRSGTRDHTEFPRLSVGSVAEMVLGRPLEAGDEIIIRNRRESAPDSREQGDRPASEKYASSADRPMMVIDYVGDGTEITVKRERKPEKPAPSAGPTTVPDAPAAGPAHSTGTF